MIIKIKKLVPAFAFVLAVLALSSCNRGMGCPNNFSIEDSTTAVETPEAPDFENATACK